LHFGWEKKITYFFWILKRFCFLFILGDEIQYKCKGQFNTRFKAAAYSTPWSRDTRLVLCVELAISVSPRFVYGRHVGVCGCNSGRVRRPRTKSDEGFIV